MTKIIMYAALAIAILGGIGGFAAKLYNDGIQAERTAQLTKAVKLVKQRDALDAKIKTASSEDVCRILGGKTVNGECI